MGSRVLATARTFVIVPIFFVYSLILATFVIIVALFDPAAPVIDRTVRHWSGLFLRIPPCSVTAEGLEHVDPTRRYVVASNHLSTFDIPLLFRVLPVNGRFLAKKELYRIPIIGTAMKRIGIIKIDRQAGASSRQAINEGVQLAAERGYSLLVFPEGTRSTTGELLPFKKGAFRIAIDTGLPLLPVVLEGTDRISLRGGKVFYPGAAQVRILPPIETADMTNKDDLNDLLRTVEKDMQETYREMRGADHQS